VQTLVFTIEKKLMPFSIELVNFFYCNSGEQNICMKNATFSVEAHSLCHPNPCQGGGTCEEHDGTFTCYCPEGLTGSRCQHDVTKTNISVASFVGDSLIGVITPGWQTLFECYKYCLPPI
jgi:hypothetical protein